VPERNQVQDAGVEHDLHAHQHDDRVLASQRAAQPDHKQDQREDQVISQGNRHRRRMTSSNAITTAPISAAVNSTAIASNGTTQSAIKTFPISSADPVAFAPAGAVPDTASK